MEIPHLQQMIVILALSIGVILTCHRIRVPTIVGFLFTGVLCGPHALGLIATVDEVRVLAEIGIVVLLFTIGLDFSLKKILEYKRYFLLGGALQVGLTSLFGYLLAYIVGRPQGEALFLGFLLSLSSTAIVLKMVQERLESTTPHGRCILGILIFQDIIVVPMMLLTPILAGNEGSLDFSFLWLAIKGMLILGVTYYIAVQVVPGLLYYVARTRSRELFLLTITVIGLSVAFVASHAGLSLALGAFLAGLIISESEYNRQAVSDMLPFEDIFLSIFFVSIGMLLDVNYVLHNAGLVVLISAAVILMKSTISTIVASLTGLSIRSAVLVGFALSQVGEFSFVLVKVGIDHGIGTDYLHQLFLSVAILTMALSPLLFSLSRVLSKIVTTLPLPEILKTGFIPLQLIEEAKHVDHVIIVGYGLSGYNLARSTKEAGIPYLILDMDPDIVRNARRKEEPIFYGDATFDHVLIHAGVRKAKAIAVLVNDVLAAFRVVEHARRLNPDIYLIVRTRQLDEMKPMYDLGADDVIPDEFGSSVEIFTRVLLKYKIPSTQISRLVDDLRKEGYEMLRIPYTERTVFSKLKDHLKEVEVKAIRVRKHSPLIGKNLRESELRNKYGVTVLIIRRQGKTIHDLRPDTVIESDDILICVGPDESLDRIVALFNQERML